jgi:hypothetical protein
MYEIWLRFRLHGLEYMLQTVLRGAILVVWGSRFAIKMPSNLGGYKLDNLVRMRLWLTQLSVSPAKKKIQ